MILDFRKQSDVKLLNTRCHQHFLRHQIQPCNLDFNAVESPHANPFHRHNDMETYFSLLLRSTRESQPIQSVF